MNNLLAYSVTLIPDSSLLVSSSSDPRFTTWSQSNGFEISSSCFGPASGLVVVSVDMSISTNNSDGIAIASDIHSLSRSVIPSFSIPLEDVLVLVDNPSVAFSVDGDPYS